MKESVKIFVEGDGDVKFISDLISYKYNIEISKQNIVKVDGYTNLHNKVDFFQKNTDKGGTNIIIFDADDTYNNGGFAVRNKEIEAQKVNLGIEFDLFLFPNNKLNGNLETLLCSIVNEDKLEIFDCWSGFENCINKLDKKYTVPANKTKVYSFLEVLHGHSNSEKDMIKDRNRDFKNYRIWNLNSENLDSLYNFLSIYFS